ncbi:MAG: hypothetical protein ACRDE5_14165, partial [Ginsengibacter sp.]
MNFKKQHKNNGLLRQVQQLFSTKQVKAPAKQDSIYELVFQSTVDAYIIYDKETLEVIETNKKVISLFELPPDKEPKGLFMSQFMMRYLAADSPNLDLLMNNISDRWTGEANFITHTKKVFYGLVNT